MFDPAVQDVVAGLMDQAGRAQIFQNGNGLPGLFGIVGRQPDIKCAARPHDVIQRLHGFFQRRVGIKAVRIEDIHIVEPHPLQRLVARGDQVFAAAPFAVGAAPHQVACLGRDDQLVPQPVKIGLEDVAERLFGAAGRWAVIVGQVEMGDALIKGRAADRLLCLMRGVVAEVVPQAQRNGRQHQAGLAATAVDHAVVTVFGGDVTHAAVLSGGAGRRRCGRLPPVVCSSGQT